MAIVATAPAFDAHAEDCDTMGADKRLRLVVSNEIQSWIDCAVNALAFKRDRGGCHEHQVFLKDRLKPRGVFPRFRGRDADIDQAVPKCLIEPVPPTRRHAQIEAGPDQFGKKRWHFGTDEFDRSAEMYGSPIGAERVRSLS